MDRIKTLAGSIHSIHLEKIDLIEPFIDLSARFASMLGTVVLMSGGELDCARYHILAAKPWLSFIGRGHFSELSVDDQSFQLEADPFDTLRTLLDIFRFDSQKLPPQLPAPVAAGLFGYLSYDLKDNLEKLPRTSIDDLYMPHICFFAPSIIVIHDKIKNNTFKCVPKRILSGGSTLENDLEMFEKIMASDPPKKGNFSGGERGFKSNLDKAGYLDSVGDIKEYIASGHVYQVNMSQRFEMDFEGDTFSLFKTLYNNNPAPFFAFINAGSHQIVSTSPERFIQRTGNRVETRPIKGTRPRGKSPEEDARLRRELMESRKDDAELSMIVDLLRNDLGKVCAGGTVRVTQHKRLEAYQNVYHLVSIVEGTLDRNYDSVDLIIATFPGGSITGCPKIRSMEIIDELEPNRRHIYTGSIGYISFHDTMDLSIAIRTATILKNRIIFSVGGGIVIDSDPEDEFKETLQKGQTLMQAFQGNRNSSGKHLFAWINGTIKPMDQASIPVTDQGFQYGYGFFETIRVNKGKPKFLEEHIRRFNRAWEQLFFQEPPDLTWDEIIEQIIRKNDLKEAVAAVKIIATKGDRNDPPFNNTLIATAHAYTHRLEGKQENGLGLATYPEPRLTPLADHKTLNYLYYFLAGKWAKANKADEALIMNPDGTVSETNTGNIMLIKDKTVIIPSSSHVLPGTMEGPVCRLLIEWGHEIIRKSVFTKDLFESDLVLVTNSLMGAVPALSLDMKRLPTSSDLWQKINDEVL